MKISLLLYTVQLELSSLSKEKGFEFSKFLQKVCGWGSNFSHKKGEVGEIGGCIKKGVITYFDTK